jgi:hypothetical protein
MKIGKYSSIFLILLVCVWSSCTWRTNLYDLASGENDTGSSFEGELLLVYATAASNTGVRVCFSEDVDISTAQDPANYTISGLTVIRAVRDPGDLTTVHLTTSSQNALTYSLTVTDVKSAAGELIGCQNSDTFAGDAAPDIQNVSSYSNTEVRVSFTEDVELTTAEDQKNYRVSGLTVFSACRDSVDYSLVILVTSTQDAASYTLYVSGVKDLTGNSVITPCAAGLTGTAPVDTTPPALVSASLLDNDTIEVVFSEPVAQTSCENTGNYTIEDSVFNPVSLSNATRQTDQSKVHLDVTDVLTKGSYIITVSTDVQDLNCNALVGTPQNETTFAGLATMISDVIATANTEIRVQFSTEVELSKAENPSYYDIPGLAVTSAARNAADHSIVDLTTSAQEDTTYLLTVTNVIDGCTKSFSGDVCPFIESVSSYGNSEVAVNFSEAVDEASSQTASNYNIAPLSVLTATRSADDFSKVILDTSPQAGNTIYKLTIENVADLTGNPLFGPNTMQFYGTGTSDTTPPVLLSAELVDGNTACLHFSEPMDQSSSETSSHYTILNNTGNFTSIDVAELQSPDGADVCLHITGTFSAPFYTVTVSTDVRDDNGQQLSGYPDNIASFSGMGSPPESFAEGPVIEDPMNETTTEFCMLTKYRGRVYVGPADSDNAVFRIKPDGSDPEIVSFVFDTGSVISHTLDPGPDGEDGIDYICGGNIGGEEHLFVGPSKSGGNLDYIYSTKETGTTLHFDAIDLSGGSVLGAQTKGMSAMSVFNDRLYVGFPDTGGKRPYLLMLKNIVQNPVEDTDVFNLRAEKMPRIGVNGDFGKKNTAGTVGIDSFGVYSNRLYLTCGGHNSIDEDGGIIRSTTATPESYDASPGDWEDVTPTGDAFWYNDPSFDRFSMELPAVNKLIPSDKAFPAMAVFNGVLYVARNTKDFSNRPQLWKFDGSSWTLVAENGSGVTSMGYADNSALSLLVASGDRLYMGFDNSNSGLQVWRSLEGVTDPQFESDFEPVTLDGFGDPAFNQLIYHGLSISDKIKDYLWLLCGKSGDSLRIFCTNNEN